jgi:CubicO group peptidase (beta-lactamase class C family)
MKSFKICVASVPVLILLLMGTVVEAAPQPAMSPSADVALSQFLNSAVDHGDVPGVVVVIVARDGVLYERAAGKVNVAKNLDMPTNAIFRIASMTKPITSVAIMMLVEQGKLSLDDPVSRYLPAFENAHVITQFDPASGTYETRAAKRPLTIRHLMAHTSGIGYGFSSPVVARLLEGTQKTELDVPLLDDPGDKWTYGAGTRVLGLVVEKLSGQPLDEFFRTQVFEPLGMSDTAFVVPPDNVSRVVTLHRRTDEGLVEQPNPPEVQNPVRGDAGLFTTARDYGTFLRMLLNGGSLASAKILNEQSVTAMGENQIGALFVEEQPAANPALTKPFPLGAGRDKFGLGFQIAVEDERDGNVRSPGSLSWAGLNNTHFWIDPSRGIGVVVLMQVLPFYDDAAIGTLRGFEELVYAHLREGADE